MHLIINKDDVKDSHLKEMLNYDNVTLKYEPGDGGGYVGQIVEVPCALSQGANLDELIENILDALTLCLEVQRDRKMEK